MASSKLDWHGMDDGTPASKPADPNDQPFDSGKNSIDWKGLPDGTPSSSPKDPDKQ